jgi:hypothetical protein
MKMTHIQIKNIKNSESEYILILNMDKGGIPDIPIDPLVRLVQLTKTKRSASANPNVRTSKRSCRTRNAGAMHANPKTAEIKVPAKIETIGESPKRTVPIPVEYAPII